MQFHEFVPPPPINHFGFLNRGGGQTHGFGVRRQIDLPRHPRSSPTCSENVVLKCRFPLANLRFRGSKYQKFRACGAPKLRQILRSPKIWSSLNRGGDKLKWGGGQTHGIALIAQLKPSLDLLIKTPGWFPT